MKLILTVLMVLMFCNTAQATLMNGSVLDFSAAANSGTSIIPPNGNGSWFGIDPTHVGVFGIASYHGLVIGATQDASGSHSGNIDGTESPTISQPFTFLGNTGMVETKSLTSIISASGNQASIDLSGLGWDWNGLEVNFYDPTVDNGVATITCALDCSVGDIYMLDYTGHVPVNDPSGFGGLDGVIHLEGTISSVPLPAAVWLFASGLLGLGQFTRKGRKVSV